MIKHRLNCTDADAPGNDDATVRVSNWNDDHRYELPVSLGGFVTLTNVGTSYDAIAASKGLGIAAISFDGVDEIEMRVAVSKIGTGTQSWQLWNVTDNTEIGVIFDAGAAGDKLLSLTITMNIPTGVKLVRMRCKSTVGADDPLYYGSALLLRRKT